MDRYELVVSPLTEGEGAQGDQKYVDEANIVKAADKKKITPKMMQIRRDAFHKTLLEKTMEKHEVRCFLMGHTNGKLILNF